jgi:hypothetical protein
VSDYLPNYPCPPGEGPLSLSWQPVESAPKDGRQLLLWFPSVGSLGTMVAAFWHLDAGKARPKPHWRQTGSQTRLYPEKWNPYGAARLDRPTHWMPLPAGPARAVKEHA